MIWGRYSHTSSRIISRREQLARTSERAAIEEVKKNLFRMVRLAFVKLDSWAWFKVIPVRFNVKGGLLVPHEYPSRPDARRQRAKGLGWDTCRRRGKCDSTQRWLLRGVGNACKWSN